jgi:hypothetical protein
MSAIAPLKGECLHFSSVTLIVMQPHVSTWSMDNFICKSILRTTCLFQSSEITPQELDNLIESIDLEISIQKSNISKKNVNMHFQQNPSTLLSLHKSLNETTANLIGYASQSFQNNETQGNVPSQSSKKSASPGQNWVESLKDIGDEVNGLQEMIDKLQMEIGGKQTEFRSDMQQISERFDEVMSIGKKNI